MNSLIIKATARSSSRVVNCSRCSDKINLYSNVSVRNFLNVGDKIPVNYMKGIYIYVYMYIRMYMYIHIYIHIYKCVHRNKYVYKWY
jgi:hypothetical protein